MTQGGHTHIEFGSVISSVADVVEHDGCSARRQAAQWSSVCKPPDWPHCIQTRCDGDGACSSKPNEANEGESGTSGGGRAVSGDDEDEDGDDDETEVEGVGAVAGKAETDEDGVETEGTADDVGAAVSEGEMPIMCVEAVAETAEADEEWKEGDGKAERVSPFEWPTPDGRKPIKKTQ